MDKRDLNVKPAWCLRGPRGCVVNPRGCAWSACMAWLRGCVVDQRGRRRGLGQICTYQSDVCYYVLSPNGTVLDTLKLYWSCIDVKFISNSCLQHYFKIFKYLE